MRHLIQFASLASLLGLCLGCDSKQAAAPVSTPVRARLDAALAIKDSFQKDDALVAVAKDAAKGGDAAVVKEALGKISNSFTKDDTAAECAFMLAKSGKGTEAAEVAQKISNSFTRDATLAKLAKGD